MGLTDLWKKDPGQLQNKSIKQLIAFAGSGTLKDESDSSKDLREFLSVIPPELLVQYIPQCLQGGFDENGLALQDIVNEVGRRLGFDVVNGRYRGSVGQIGHDGLWKLPDGRTILVEVKTTDTYRIDLDGLANYRTKLIKENKIRPEGSSILIVVGRDNTGGLESQIRGSRHAWDMRLISVDALISLMALRGKLENPRIVRQIADVLTPREFTKVDEIIDLVFSTAEDIQREEALRDVEAPSTQEGRNDRKFVPVNFNEACVRIVEKAIDATFVRRSRATFVSSDRSIALVCAVSREYDSGDSQGFWFAFHPHQKEFLSSARKSFVAFGCGSEKSIVLIPFKKFDSWIEGLNITRLENSFYWHVQIFRTGTTYSLRRRAGHSPVNVSEFIIT